MGPARCFPRLRDADARAGNGADAVILASMVPIKDRPPLVVDVAQIEDAIRNINTVCGHWGELLLRMGYRTSVVRLRKALWVSCFGLVAFMFFHATLKLLLGVCVDGFEMFGPTVGIAKTFGIYSL